MPWYSRRGAEGVVGRDVGGEAYGSGEPEAEEGEEGDGDVDGPFVSGEGGYSCCYRRCILVALLGRLVIFLSFVQDVSRGDIAVKE